MPAVKKTMQYRGLAPLGSNTPETSVRVTAGNGARTMLLIQNTGANDGLVHFGEDVHGDGSDILFTAGAGLLWDRETTVPESAINVGSALGTTFLIVEQVTQ